MRLRLSGLTVALAVATVLSSISCSVNANPKNRPDKSKEPAITISQIVITVDTTTSDGRSLTLRTTVPGDDLRDSLGAARKLLADSFTLTTDPPGPIPYIFKCGGDFEKSDGTCSDVIADCVTIGIEFECNKYDDEGVCTNGGC